MKAAAAIAEILKREGVSFLIGYPVNTILEAAAQADIRTIIVRQERVGLHMADAVSRVSSGQKIGVFAMQHGPGAENSFGGVAQAYGDSVPIVVLPGGYPRRITNVAPNFNSALNYRHVTKWCEEVLLASEVPNAMRRAFTQVRNGRPRPVLVEVPVDIFPRRGGGAPRLPAGAPDAQRARTRGRWPTWPACWSMRERPVIYAGQGVHYAQAWRAAPRAGRAARGAGDDEPAGQERVPREPSALARLRRPLDLQAAPSLPHERRRHLRHRMQLHDDQLRRADAQGQGDDPGHARRGGPRQGHPDRPRADRRCRAHAGGADRRGEDAARRQAARARRGGHQGDRDAQGRVARPVDASAHPEHHAAVSVPRHLGPDAHRGSRQHDHHPRRGKPARSALAVLGDHCAHDLHRLGQDDPARHRARLCHGRQARRSPTSSASTSGATPPSASRAWTSRRPCASASRSSRCC